MAYSNTDSIASIFRSARALPAAGAFDPRAYSVIFEVALVPEDESLLVVLDGDGELVANIRIYRGIDALDFLRAHVSDPKRRTESATRSTPWIEVGYESLELMPLEYREFLSRFGLSSHERALVPLPVAFPESTQRRPVNSHETKMLARVMKALEVALRSKAASRAYLFDATEMSRITAPPKPTSENVRVERVPIEAPVRVTPAVADDDLVFTHQLLGARATIAVLEHRQDLEPAFRMFLGPRPQSDTLDRNSVAQLLFGFSHWMMSQHPEQMRELLAHVDGAPLSPVERSIFDACAGSTPRYYRVLPHENDRCVVQDALDGSLAFVEDLSLWQNAAIDRWTAGAVVQVGERSLFSRWLPIFDFARGELAPQVFDAYGFAPTSDALKNQPHLVGRLTSLILSANRQPHEAVKRVDPRELIAGFRVGDPRALRAAFEARADIGYVGRDEFEWFDETTDPSGDRQRVRLARMQLVTTTTTATPCLVVEPNDERILAAAIAWLEGVSQVTFEYLGAHAVDEVVRPPRIGGDPSAAVIEPAIRAAREALARRHDRWLERPLPSLGGVSPRIAAASPRHRDHVRFLIGILYGSNPQYVPRVEPDHARLLRAVGL